MSQFQSTSQTLILLPGMVCNQSSWAPVIEALEGQVNLVVATYPELDSLTAMAEKVLATAPATFALAGHSMGGRVAMEICRLAPERVERLCLIATEHTGKPTGEAGQQETRARTGMIDLARQQGMRAMAEQWAPSLIDKDHPEKAGLISQVADMIAGQSLDTLRAHITAGEHRQDSASTLRVLTCPVLLIAGAADTLRPAYVMAQMKDLITDCQFESIAVCGHMPMMEQPETVSQLMQQWLRKPSTHSSTDDAAALKGSA